MARLGGFIAYDGLTSFWDETDRGQDRTLEFPMLAGLEEAARPLAQANSSLGATGQEGDAPELDDGPKDPGVIALRTAQFGLWEQLRESEIDWRVTDFVALGTPMSIANILMTKNSSQFTEARRTTLRRSSERLSTSAFIATPLKALPDTWRAESMCRRPAPLTRRQRGDRRDRSTNQFARPSRQPPVKEHRR